MRKQILRPDEVGRLLKISKRGVYRLISSGSLEAFKVGSVLRIRQDDVQAYISRQIDEYSYENGFSVTDDDMP